MSDLDVTATDFVAGQGFRRMRWNSEPLQLMHVQPNLFGDGMAEWSDWNEETGVWTLVGTNGIAKYQYVRDFQGLMVFERISWGPV